MKSRISLMMAFVFLFTILFTVNPQLTYATTMSATIDINTGSMVKITEGIRGVNNESPGEPVMYDDPDLISWVNDYGRLGYVRFPGGTNTDVFNWKTGAVDEEFLGQMTADDKHYFLYGEGKRIGETKGYERLDAFRNFLQQTGAKAMITVNTFQHTRQEVGQLASYLYKNNVPVLYFELGNEPSFFTDETNDGNPEIFKTGSDYLNRMKIMNDEIKANYPGAKTVVFMSNGLETAFDEDFLNYDPNSSDPNKVPYWDGITFHRFRGDGDTFLDGMKSANYALDDWTNVLNYYKSNLKNKNTPYYVGEHGVALGKILANSHYHGLYVAESVLRLSQYSNVDYIGGYRLVGGIANAGTDYSEQMEDAYQDNITVDTKNYDFNFYKATPAVSLQVVDGAINYSDARWGTTVTGGDTVEKSDGTTMPALFAQAYRGTNGKNYVVIVNKSANDHNITIKMDGAAVGSALTKTYATGNYNARNSSSSPNLVSVQTVGTANPVNVAPYSVTRIEWTRTTTLDKPEASWVTHANIADSSGSQVDLKWLPSLNATSYTVKYGTSSANLSNVVPLGNVTTYSVTGLTPDSTYYFTVSASNSSGESANSNVVNVSLTAPTAPSILEAYAEKSGRAVIEWSTAVGASAYILSYGKTSGGSDAVDIDVGNNVGYIVEGLDINNTTYYFTVTAKNAIGTSVKSNEKSVIPSATLPLAPYNLTFANESTAKLSWTPAFTQRDFDYFEGGSASQWTSTAGWSVIEHPDTNRNTMVYMAPSVTNAYAIFNQYAPNDMEFEATLEVPDPYGTTNSQVGLVARYTDENNHYRFVYDGTTKQYKIVKADKGVKTEIAVADANENDKLTMRLYIKGSKIEGKVGASTVLSVTDSTHTVGDVGLYSKNQVVYFDSIRMRWDNADQFEVFRSTSPYINFESQGIVTGTTFIDAEAAANPTRVYYYKVRAINDGLNSYGYSNTIRKN